MRVLLFFGLAVWCALCIGAARADQIGMCKFDTEELSFHGTAPEQAKCLLRKVAEKGAGSSPQTIPAYLLGRVGSEDVPTADAMEAYLTRLGVPVSTLGGADATAPLHARYLIIHDTSSPELPGAEVFPDEIDDADWFGNKIAPPNHSNIAQRVGLLINHAGASRTMTAWGETRTKTATKLESALPKAARDLFIHIENIQPRIQTPGTGFAWKAPDPGFSEAQLERLALAYVMAIVRSGHWLIPAFHFNVDTPIPDTHDDPQHFPLEAWVEDIEAVVAQLENTAISVRLRDARDLAFDCPAEGSCPLACAAHLEVSNPTDKVIDSFDLAFPVPHPTIADPDGNDLWLRFSDGGIASGETRTIAGEVGRSKCEGVDFHGTPKISCGFDDGSQCSVGSIEALDVVAPHADSATSHTFHLASTIYYLALESDYPAGADASFRTVDGRVIAKASEAFVHAAEIEGSAKLADGRVINYADRVGGTVRWQVVDAPFGLGVRGCHLVPFRSVAVDPDVIPLMSKVHITETEGLVLPDGSVHDGNWYAVDIGGGINGERVDLFGGAGKAAMDVIYGHGIDHLQALTVTIEATGDTCPEL